MNAPIPLASLTTIQLGGPPACLVRIRSVEALRTAVAAEKDQPTPFFVLGGGSNVVFSDRGYPGTVLKMEIPGISVVAETVEFTDVCVGAGESWDGFVAWSVEKNLQGIECLSGIPGSTGATPIQNVGAYGQEVAETILFVDTLDTQTLETVRFTQAECSFAYRDSRFKSVEPGRFIVTQVTFRLRKNTPPSLRYAELRKAAETAGAKTLAEIRSLVLDIRRGKGMVVDAADPDSISCGSFFTNPIIAEADLAAVRARCSARGLDPESMPVFPHKPGQVKLSAAWLIERAGVQKGYTRNGAGISSKHSLALVNRGGNAEALLAIKNYVQNCVQEAFGIVLVPEPILAGF